MTLIGNRTHDRVAGRARSAAADVAHGAGVAVVAVGGVVDVAATRDRIADLRRADVVVVTRERIVAGADAARADVARGAAAAVVAGLGVGVVGTADGTAATVVGADVAVVAAGGRAADAGAARAGVFGGARRAVLAGRGIVQVGAALDGIAAVGGADVAVVARRRRAAAFARAAVAHVERGALVGVVAGGRVVDVLAAGEASQLSSVQLLASSQSSVVPASQLWLVQCSAPVQTLPSSQSPSVMRQPLIDSGRSPGPGRRHRWCTRRRRHSRGARRPDSRRSGRRFRRRCRDCGRRSRAACRPGSCRWRRCRSRCRCRRCRRRSRRQLTAVGHRRVAAAGHGIAAVAGADDAVVAVERRRRRLAVAGGRVAGLGAVAEPCRSGSSPRRDCRRACPCRSCRSCRRRCRRSRRRRCSSRDRLRAAARDRIARVGVQTSASPQRAGRCPPDACRPCRRSVAVADVAVVALGVAAAAARDAAVRAHVGVRVAGVGGADDAVVAGRRCAVVARRWWRYRLEAVAEDAVVADLGVPCSAVGAGVVERAEVAVVAGACCRRPQVPVPGSHVSSVHGLTSSQLRGVPGWQVPPLHASPSVQALLSLHGSVLLL